MTEPFAEPEPRHRVPQGPWYARRGLQGDLQVEHVPPVTDEAMSAVFGLELPGRDRELVTGIRAAAAALLRQPEPEAWMDRLRFGELHCLHGRLVWLCPTVDNMAPLPQAAEPEDRQYDVSYNSTAGGTETTRVTTRTVEAGLLGILRLATGAVQAVAPGAPVLGAETATSSTHSTKQTVISGHKLRVLDRVAYRSDIRLRVFVDGVACADVVVGRGLRVSFPREHADVSEGPSAQAEAPSAPTTSVSRHRRPGEVLNAIDLVPFVAAVQRDLRSAGLDVSAAADVTRQAQDALLNERTARSRSRWWLTSGDTSPELSYGIQLPGLGAFRGYFRVSAALHSGQLLGISRKPTTRTDQGTGGTITRSSGGESAGSLTVGVNALGIEALPSDVVRGLAPQAAVTVTSARGWHTRLTSQVMPHTVLTHEDDMARYGSVLHLQAEWVTSTHRSLTVTKAAVYADLGVPWRGGGGPIAFEERAFGRVVSPYLDRTATGSAPESGGIGGQPHVLALPRAVFSGGLSPRQPVWAGPFYEPRRHEREPLALAARIGLGTGTALGMGGAEVVHDSVRQALREATSKGRHSPVLPDALLDAYFGAPALEGDLTNLLAGVSRTVQVDKVPFTIDLQARLLDSRGVFQDNLRVNTRLATGMSLAAIRDTRKSVKSSLGGGVRINVADKVRFQLGGLRLIGTLSWGSGLSITKADKTYVRKETGGGSDRHTLDLGFHVRISSPLGVRQWWLAQPDELVAEVSVPHDSMPPRAIDEAAPDGIRLHLSRNWPDPPDTTLRLQQGTSGVYPHFPALPQLHHVVSRFYDGPLPDAFVKALQPGSLCADFKYLASDRGLTLDHERGDGWTATMRLRLRVSRPRLQAVGGATEIEALQQAVIKAGSDKHQGWSTALHVAAGPQASLSGSQEGDESADLSGTADRRSTSAHLALLAEASAKSSRHVSRREASGAVHISRATHEGDNVLLEGDLAFEVVLGLSKGRQQIDLAPLYVAYSRGATLLMPARRWEDTRPGTRRTSLVPPDRRYFNGGRVPTAIAHCELLQDDTVLETMLEQARKRGIIREASSTGLEHAEPLQRALEVVFRKENLIAEVPLLLSGSAVSVALPYSKQLGASRTLWASVTAHLIEAADSSRPRPDTQLTHRSESVEEVDRERKKTTTFTAGVNASAYGGTHNPDHNERSQGGLAVTLAFAAARGQAQRELTKTTDIYRATTKDPDGCHEFTHQIQLTVEMGETAQLPEAIGAPLRALSSLWRARGTRGGDSAARSLWQWSSADGSPVRVGVRLLVPSHLTLPAHQPVPPSPQLVALPSASVKPWWGQPAVPGKAFAPELPTQFLASVFPGEMAAAGALNAWLAFASHALKQANRPPLPADPLSLPVGLDRRPASDTARRYAAGTGSAWLRPRLRALLTMDYLVTVADLPLRVGLRITDARIIGPCDGGRWKGRRYDQREKESDRQVFSGRGVHFSATPFAGSGTSDETYLGKTHGGYSDTLDEKITSALEETGEHNTEGTKLYRWYVFDVRLVIQPVEAPVRALYLDVPGGLTAMLPMDGPQLEHRLETVSAMPWLSPYFQLTRQHPGLGRLLRLSHLPGHTGMSPEAHAEVSAASARLRAIASEDHRVSDADAHTILREVSSVSSRLLPQKQPDVTSAAALQAGNPHTRSQQPYRVGEPESATTETTPPRVISTARYKRNPAK
ncbi:hypothetical protein AB0911_36075 [Streptomyces nigra]|uniref:hypothetical protein n=1 Tax=Streptomyces nigra TaxID=1827580 RepID=UPI0034552C4A